MTASRFKRTKGDIRVNLASISATRPMAQQLRNLWLMALVVGLLLAQAVAAQARPDSFADLADKVSPSVVNITTSTVVERGTDPSPMVPEGSPFEDFFE